MIHRISEEIAYRLNENLSWVDTCVGIVKPITYSSNGESKTIPVYFNNKRDLCSGADYLTIIPDSSKVSVAYMELNEDPNVISYDQRGTRFSANVNVILWFNYQRINIGMIDNDMLIANVIDKIPERLPNDTYNSVFIEVTGSQASNDNIFDKYSYNQDQQYTMYPYGSFVVNLNVEYTIPKGCVSLNIEDGGCNLKPIVLTIGKDKVEVPFGVIKY